MMKKSHISYFLLTLFVLSSGLQAQCPKCGHELSKEAPAAVTPLESLDIASSDSDGLTDGVYVGATLGVNMDVSKQQFWFNYASPDDHYEFRAKSKAFSFLFGGNFGYLRVFKETFMGIEVGYLGPQTAVKQSGQVVYPTGTAHFDTKYHQDFAVHLVQKFGWLLSPCTGVYVKAGPVFTQFTFKGKITNHPRALGGAPAVVTGAWVSHQQKRLGVDLGVGVLHDLGDGWMMAFECSHRRFQKIKYDFEPAGDDTTEIKFTPKQTMAMLTFAYAF